MLSDRQECILIRQTIGAWIRAGITPVNMLNGISEAFDDSQPLIDAGYEVYDSNLHEIRDDLTEIAKKVKTYGWD